MSKNIYCSHCGGILSENGFCQSCGASINHAKTQPTQQPQVIVQQMQQQQQTQPVVIQQVKSLNQLSDTAMLFTVLGWLILPIIGGIVGVICGILALKNPHKKTQTILALVFSSISLIPTIILFSMFWFWF